ncbi:MAG: M48 family metalloprotease, partial [Kangiellaceae bacterium]|nr:M48 family metalloprotease [Kangiellaceae bacterium]
MKRLTQVLITISSTILSCTVLFAASNRLPELGSSTSKALSVTQEQLMGDEYILGVRRYLPLVDDPLVRDYINQVGFQLIEQNPDAQDRRFYFFVLKDPSLNAFALPGGYIGVHSGLITAAENESELAAVLGHEVAHVTQRHLARRLEKRNQFSFPSLAAFIGGLILASQNPEAGIGLMTAS